MADINKTDIDKAIDKKLKVFLSSTDLKDKINKIVTDRIKNDKGLEDKIVNINKNVQTQLYKALWQKRGFWRSMLKNQPA